MIGLVKAKGFHETFANANMQENTTCPWRGAMAPEILKYCFQETGIFRKLWRWSTLLWRLQLLAFKTLIFLIAL